MVAKTVFLLGWTLTTNTRYPFPEYALKGVVREWITQLLSIWLSSESYPTIDYTRKIKTVSTNESTEDHMKIDD